MSAIVAAATAEFERAGFAGATTAAIAAKAGVTEAQLFRHFGSKANLFRETVFKPIDEHFRRFIDRHMLDDDAGLRRIAGADVYTNELQDFIAENRALILSLVVVEAYDDGAGGGIADSGSLGRYFDRGAAIMRRRTGGRSKVDPRLMVRVSFAAVLACMLFRKWILPAGLASEAEVREAINVFIAEGIGIAD